MGTERRSMIMSDEDKRITAYHEAGHALVALLTPEHSDPVHKVTIIPRGMALGLTQTLPEEDRLNYTEEQIYAIIRYAMGGRAAEELVFDHLSTGAANDLKQATTWARRMITEYGMSDVLGPGLLLRQRRRRLPRPRFHGAQGLQREEGGADRRRGRRKILMREVRTRRARSAHRESRQAGPHRRGAARARDPRDNVISQLLLRGEPLPDMPPPSEPRRLRSAEVSRARAQPGGLPGGELPIPSRSPRPRGRSGPVLRASRSSRPSA